MSRLDHYELISAPFRFRSFVNAFDRSGPNGLATARKLLALIMVHDLHPDTLLDACLIHRLPVPRSAREAAQTLAEYAFPR